jgi:O-antigen/teichoic acid export membrane protein
LLSKNILSLYGKGYVNIELFIVLISSTLFSSFCSVIGLAIASKGKMWNGFIFNIFWAVYFILFTNYFIKLGYGALGLAYAIALSYLLHGIAQFVYFKLRLKKD